MRDAVIDGQFQHLRIDHDQAALLRPQPIEQAQDHRVDGDRFAGAGGSRNQKMRHAREIDDNGLAADGLSQTQRQLRGVVRIVVAGEQFPQINLLARGIGQLDPDGIAPRDHGNARGKRAHGTGDIVREADHARGFYSRSRLELVEGDHRARTAVDDLAAHAEIAENPFERGGIGRERVGAEHRTSLRLGRGEQLERRQHVAAARAALRARPRRARRALGGSSSGSPSGSSSCGFDLRRQRAAALANAARPAL